MNEKLPPIGTEQDHAQRPVFTPVTHNAASFQNEYSRIEVRDCAFSFKCPKSWDSLQTTENENVRYCNECKEHVWFCKTTKALRYASSKGRCVAVEVVALNAILGTVPLLGRIMTQFERTRDVSGQGDELFSPFFLKKK